MPRKKSKEKKPVRNKTEEYCGWSAGDMFWVVANGDNKPSQGEIIEFHPNDMIAPAVSYIEIISGKYRTAKFSLISENKKEAKNLKIKDLKSI
jgi:hypothetical protein